METVLVQNKIKLLFEKMSAPGYIMNNYYADGLINKLAEDTEPEISFMKLLTQISDLITDALGRIEECHATVKVFLVRLLAIASKKELHFAKIFSKRGEEIAKRFREINSSGINPSLRVAHMEVALAMVSHDTGVSWLLETGVWKEILSLCSEKQTVFVVRQTYKFASRFMWKLNDMSDETNIRQVLSHVLKPVQEIDFCNIYSLTPEMEESFTKVLEPMLHIIMAVVTEVDYMPKQNILMGILLREHGIVSYLHLVMDRMREMTLQTTKLIVWLTVAKSFLVKPLTADTVYVAEDFIEVLAVYFNIVQTFVARRSATGALDFCTACNLIWLAICRNKSFNYSRESTNIHNKLLFMCLVPTLVYIKEMGKDKYTEKVYERIKGYITKILNGTCEHTAKAAYALRDLSDQLDSLTITIQSVKRLTCMKNHLNNEQANFVFQALFYILIEYDPTIHEVTEEMYEDSQDKVLVMTYVLDNVLYLVKHHDINWCESLEVICLYNIVYNILQRPNLSCKFVVTALNVIAVTVKKFLPPNLSLLLESKPGSSMHELGKLIYMKMHDLNWEVRDSALELLLVCTHISYIKFPPFQKQIMEKNLINVAATIAFNDHEFYVQASALKCVGAATQVSAIWEQLRVQYPCILEKLLSILRNNQEGIVRKEACNVLCEVYQNIKLTPAFKHTLYEHMVSSALSDFHWEVQLAALKFWKIVIQSLLNDQGMLDGTFPPVTFSRETRKIVTLNDIEIQKRLLRILNELASIGCLTVLVKLLQEDTEVEIMDTALSLALEIDDILSKYKVHDGVKLNENEVATVEELLCYIKEEEIDGDQDMANAEAATTSDNVIDGILNASDINLLANIYERHMSLETGKAQTNTSEICTPKIKLLKFASPYLFVNHLKKNDLKALLENKRKWKEGIRSLSSLLDDVLGIYEMNEEVNTLDCY
uniref:BRCA1-associated ATM activator 1 n=1 Tax=Pectinophora gossypiella TaxID=13191 RepID=A0A1E1W3R1_PECGO